MENTLEELDIPVIFLNWVQFKIFIVWENAKDSQLNCAWKMDYE